MNLAAAESTGGLEQDQDNRELGAQLYRYAEDFAKLLRSHQRLQRDNHDLKTRLHQIAKQHASLERLLLDPHDLYLSTDLQGRIQDCNPAAAAFLDDTDPRGKRLCELLPLVTEPLQQALQQAQIQDRVELEWLLSEPSGAQRVLHLRVLGEGAACSGQNQGQGQLRWVLHRENKERFTDLKTLMSTQQFYDLGEAIIFTDLQGRIQAVNGEFSRITGYSAEEAVGQTPALLKSGLQGESFYRMFWHILQETGNWQGEILNRRKDGELYAQWLSVTRIEPEDGGQGGYIAVFSDISHQFDAEMWLNQIAFKDRVTRLPNRALFIDRLGQAIALAKRRSDGLTLIYLDLDNFQKANRTYGQGVCDRVLQRLALRMGKVRRDSDTLARYGADEFTLVLPGLTSATALTAVAERLLQAVAQPIEIDGWLLELSASLGIACFPQQGEDVGSLMHSAVDACYRASLAGGGCYEMPPIILADDSQSEGQAGSA
jgi:diguanylate cyclase (GGDEF)-like protein/PAS domain S-box-containing protein